jgi:hypothetical protein
MVDAFVGELLAWRLDAGFEAPAIAMTQCEFVIEEEL